jgi:hypothetical protein
VQIINTNGNEVETLEKCACTLIFKRQLSLVMMQEPLPVKFEIDPKGHKTFTKGVGSLI